VFREEDQFFVKEKEMQIAVVRHMRLPLAILAALAAVSLFAQTPLIEQGRAAISRGDTAAAIEILEKAVAQSPKSAEAHFYLATAYASEGQKSGMLGAARYASKMKDEFEKAIALNPKYVEARFGLVQFYASAPGIMGGSYDQAFEQAKEIKAIDPIVGHRAYAFIYSQQKKPDLAKQEYLDAIREQPKSAKAHSYLGQYLVNAEKNYTAAFAEFETALKLDPSYMPAFYHLGRTAVQANTNLARGEEALKKYLAYTPKENEPALANAHYFLGAIYENEGKKAEAKQSYQAALKLNPSLKEASEALKRVS
jgi:Tfp pilus assembly protein PilF